MAATATCLAALFTCLTAVGKVQRPLWEHAYVVAGFTMPIIWVDGLRCALRCFSRRCAHAGPLRAAMPSPLCDRPAGRLRRHACACS